MEGGSAWSGLHGGRLHRGVCMEGCLPGGEVCLEGSAFPLW